MVINIQWKKILRDSFMIKTMLKIHNNNIMEKSIINLFFTQEYPYAGIRYKKNYIQ